MSSKKDANLTQQKEMEKMLSEGFSISDKNVVTMKNGNEVWEKTLPKGATIELVDKLANHNRNFSVAYNRVAGRGIVSHMRDNKEVGSMSHRLETPLVDFGFDAARANTDNPTREQLRASVAFSHTIKLADELEDLSDELADLWNLAD